MLKFGNLREITCQESINQIYYIEITFISMNIQICSIARVYKKSRKKSEKRGEKEGRSYFHSPQKSKCHSHIAPFDKKEWHSSFAPHFGSGAQEWRSKACRSLTHWFFRTIYSAPICLRFYLTFRYDVNSILLKTKKFLFHLTRLFSLTGFRLEYTDVCRLHIFC